MSSTSCDADATGACSGETQEHDDTSDEPQWLRLPDGQLPVYPNMSAFDLYDKYGLIKCETCLRVKPRQHTGELAQYATFGISAVVSFDWHLSFPEAPRGTTIWKCVECSMAIDTAHRNWQERIIFYKGRRYTPTPDPTSEFHWPREADIPSE